jgi:hypothetical protein
MPSPQFIDSDKLALYDYDKPECDRKKMSFPMASATSGPEFEKVAAKMSINSRRAHKNVL